MRNQLSGLAREVLPFYGMCGVDAPTRYAHPILANAKTPRDDDLVG